MFHVKWCTKKSLTSSIIPVNTTIITHNHHTNIYSLLKIIISKGTIRVRTKFNQPIGGNIIHAAGDDISDRDLESGEIGGSTMSAGGGKRMSVSSRLTQELGFDKGPEDVDHVQPNELQIMIIQAKDVLAADTAIFAKNNTSDPYVILQLEGAKGEKFPEFKTKAIKKTICPVWNQKYNIPLKSQETSIKISVYDQNIGFDKFLGTIVLNASRFADRKVSKEWYTLMAEGSKNDGKPRGKIELAIKWGVNLKILEEENKKKQKGGGLFGKMRLGGQSDSEPEDDEDMMEIEEFDYGDEEESEDAIADRLEADKEKAKLLDEIEIKSGDWQLQVNLIEARDLKAENYDGTSDPIVYVEAFGQKQNTQVIFGCTTCVFDELLIFNMKNLDKEQLEEGLVRISVMDYNTMKNTMIGSYAFDVANIYQSNKSHELYRQWVPLMDDVDEEDVGVQGYLKLSVSVIGPGEKVKVHDLDAELQEEIEKENAAGGDLSSLLLSTPAVRKEWQYLVAKIYKCDGLPVMDGKTIGFSKAGMY